MADHPTLLVNLQVGLSNHGVLRVAKDVADRTGAIIVGAALCQPMQITYYDGLYSGSEIEEDLPAVGEALVRVEAEFRDALQAMSPRLEWRGRHTYAPLAEELAALSRCADLIVTATAQPATALDRWRRMESADIILLSGRPVLTTPYSAAGMGFGRALIAWKDGAPARRAIAGALPLLRHTEHIRMVEIVPEADLAVAQDRLSDVAGWLSGHGLIAEVEALASTGDDARDLRAAAESSLADYMVAGAYGHSRMREWVLGGVTRKLLDLPARCALLSH